jgi:hypothetical protein
MPALPPLPPATPTTARVELLKLDPIKDAKAFLESFETIQYYLRMPEFSTRHVDGSLSMDAANLDASPAWEGQLRLAVKDGALCFLFDNKGTQYHGQGFEMLAALTQRCHPDTVSNAFASLLSLFNDVQGESEPILEYRSHFDGLTQELSRCKVVLPHLLSVMLFLRALHIAMPTSSSNFAPILNPSKPRQSTPLYLTLHTKTASNLSIPKKASRARVLLHACRPWPLPTLTVRAEFGSLPSNGSQNMASKGLRIAGRAPWRARASAPFVIVMNSRTMSLPSVLSSRS